MITREMFFQDFECHVNRYSRYLVINATADEVISVLNSINPAMCVGSGAEFENYVIFEICKEAPDLIYNITKELKTIGYADTDWDAIYTICAKNGNDFDDFTAEWEEHYLREDEFEEDEEPIWDAFVVITDNETGVKFGTGAGAVDPDIEQYYANMIKTHSK